MCSCEICGDNTFLELHHPEPHRMHSHRTVNMSSPGKLIPNNVRVTHTAPEPLATPFCQLPTPNSKVCIQLQTMSEMFFCFKNVIGELSFPILKCFKIYLYHLQG